MEREGRQGGCRARRGDFVTAAASCRSTTRGRRPSPRGTTRRRSRSALRALDLRAASSPPCRLTGRHSSRRGRRRDVARGSASRSHVTERRMRAARVAPGHRAGPTAMGCFDLGAKLPAALVEGPRLGVRGARVPRAGCVCVSLVYFWASCGRRRASAPPASSCGPNRARWAGPPARARRHPIGGLARGRCPRRGD